MSTFLIIVTKYLFILLMLFYTIECFCALKCKNPYRASGIFQRQNGIIFLTYLLGIVTIYMNQTDTTDIGVIVLGGAQLCYLIVVLGIFPIIYPNINKAILSNMCMLLTIGFIMLARLNFKSSIRQFIMVAVVSMLSLIVPFLMSRYDTWKSFTWIYCFVGIGLLTAVLLFGDKSKGAYLALKIGSALIYFMIYVFMVYVGTHKARYLVLGFAGFSVASLVAYKLFSHVQTRVVAWKDPWSTISGAGYQVAHSLFALGNGGFTGTGLYQGKPNYVPEVEQDFIFSAVGEEFGAVFGMLLILVCLHVSSSF